MKRFITTIVVACLLGLALSCTDDSECGGPDQAGLCVSGVCQCGAGFIGSSLIDPSTCSLSCTPEAVPDSVVFLKEPLIAMAASAGNLVFNVTLDPYAKQVPTTIAFNHPILGTACDLMPARLGTARWSQEIQAPGTDCESVLSYQHTFSAAVAESCWNQLPSSVENGPLYEVSYNSYQTQVEVIQSGLAPFGQAVPSRALRDETTITRQFRRDYTIKVATQFKPQSAPFLVIAGGRIRYRLVEINYDILNDQIIATVETEVQDEAKLVNAVVDGDSSGIGPVLNSVTDAACLPSSSPGFCNQYHTITFSDEPCAITAGDMVLEVEFQCADGSDPSTCGFTDLPTDNLYKLPNLLLDYDSCPVVIEYGIDTAASFLRLHSDIPRAVPLAVPALQGDVLYGRCQIQPAGDALFQSVTLQGLKVFQVASPTNLDLGDQLASSFMTLISGATQTGGSIATWDFDLEIDAAFFAITETYFLEATIDLVFANTGSLTKKLIIPISRSKKNVGHALVSATRQNQEDVESQDDVRSSTFKLQARADEEDEPSETSSSNTTMIAVGGAIAGVAMVALCAVLIVFLVKRRKKNDEEDESLEVTISPIGDTSSDDSIKTVERSIDVLV